MKKNVYLEESTGGIAGKNETSDNEVVVLFPPAKWNNRIAMMKKITARRRRNERKSLKARAR